MLLNANTTTVLLSSKPFRCRCSIPVGEIQALRRVSNRFLTLRAKPKKLHPPIKYPIPPPILARRDDLIKGHGRQVVHPSATHASNVVVLMDRTVVSGGRPARLDLSHEAGGSHLLEVAVDRPEADRRQPTANNIVEHGRRRVAFQLPQLVENQLPLPSVSVRHAVLFFSNDNQYYIRLPFGQGLARSGRHDYQTIERTKNTNPYKINT